MILELVDLRIQPGQNTAFEAALRHGVECFIRPSPGCLGYTIHHGLESPERYVLQIRWNTLEDHTLGFRQSEAFGHWRATLGPFFASAPLVEHFQALE